MMDKSSFEKILFKGSIGIGALCYFLFVGELYRSIHEHHDIFLALLFLVIAVNCTYRFLSYSKIEQIRKSAVSREEIARAERRHWLVNSIFSNATVALFMSFMTLVLVCRGMENFYLTVLFAAIALAFAGLLVFSIRNLKRFDRL